MATRVITGQINKPNGAPWGGVAVKFRPIANSYTISPDETYPIHQVVTTTDDDGAFSVLLATGLSTAYEVTMPDGEKARIIVSPGAATTLELLRAAYEGANPAAIPSLDLIVAETVANSSEFAALLADIVNDIELPELIQDTVSTTIVAGDALSGSYDDGAGEYTLNVDVGAGAAQVAAGDHDHGADYLPAAGGTVTGNVTIDGTLGVTGATSIDDALTVNEAGADRDTRIEGDTDQNLIFVDASTDQLGIGMNPVPAGFKFGVNGATVVRRTSGTIFVQAERYANDATMNRFSFLKSRHPTPGSHTIVQNGDELGGIQFFGSDGGQAVKGASITAVVNGTPGSNDMPGGLRFSTTADGANTETERMFIDSAGRFLIASATPGTAAAGLYAYDGANWQYAENSTSGWMVSANEHVFRLAADGSAIGAAIADFFGANSSISLPASSSWELEAHLYYLKSTAGTVTYTITNSAANYTNIAAKFVQSPSTGIATNAQTTGAGIVGTTTAAAALPATGSLTTTANHYGIIYATIEMNAAGNIRIRCTESAGTITPLRGSYYKIRRIPASVGTFAA